MDVQILVVEDDEHICHAVNAFLLDAGYAVDTCFDGASALEMMYDKNYHLVILDILLPRLSGKELLKEFRKINHAPVLMITALTEDYHQIEAFNHQADDYVTKPFSMEILLKRVEALLRRSGALQQEIRIGGYTLYPETYKVLFESQEISLTLREFEILSLLARHKGRVITHEMLLTRIWGYDYEGDEGTIHTHIKNLRSKLPVNLITTVRGVGYRLATEGSS